VINLPIDKAYLSDNRDGSVAEWLACWTQAQKGPGSNRSRDAVAIGYLWQEFPKYVFAVWYAKYGRLKIGFSSR